MKDTSFDKCSYCGSKNIGIGYHLGNGNLYVDQYAYYRKVHLLASKCIFAKIVV